MKFIYLLPFLILLFSSITSYSQTDMEIAVEATLKRNNMILTELRLIKASGYDLESAKFDRLATISVQTEFDEEYEDHGYAQLLQPIWVGGRIQNTISRAEASLVKAEQRLLKVQRDLLGETIANYAQVKGIEAQIEASNLNIQEHEKLLSLIQRREKGEMSSQADIDLASSRLSQAILTKQRLEGVLEQRKNDLFTLSQGMVATESSIQQEYLDIGDMESIERRVLESSSDLILAEADLHIAQADADLTRSEMKPRVYGRLRQDFYREEDSDGDDDLETSLGLVVEMSLEGGGFSSWKRIKSSNENVRAAEMRIYATEDEVKRQLNYLLTQYSMNIRLLELNQSVLERTKKTLESYTRQYEGGRKSWLDLLNIQREYSQARLTLEELKTNQQTVSLQINNMQARFDPFIAEVEYGK